MSSSKTQPETSHLFRRFFTRLLCIGAIMLLCNAGAIWYHAQAPNARASYRTLHGKVRMLDTLPPPRIIVVGGSSVVYGQNSRLFETETGMSVVNLGSHAGIGLRYMLTNVQGRLRRGDIVLLAPEYAQFMGTFDGWHPLLDLVLQNPDALRNITSTGQIRTLVEALPMKLRTPLDRRLLALNEMLGIPGTADIPSEHLRGDTIADAPGYHGDTWNRERVRRRHPLKDWNLISHEYIDQDALERIVVFRRECAVRGVSVLLEYPPVPVGYYLACESWITRLHAALKSALPGAVLRHPRASTYDERMFLDTVYHLNAVGRDARTRDIALALRAWIRNNRPETPQ